MPKRSLQASEVEVKDVGKTGTKALCLPTTVCTTGRLYKTSVRIVGLNGTRILGCESAWSKSVDVS
jgi:hypothetical protein